MTPLAATPAHSARPAGGPGFIRMGFLPLTDAAPLIVARELGIFARRGLNVVLERAAGWATLRDRIAHGELDAAHAVAPMLWSLQLGLGTPRTDVLTAFLLNRHGNAITLSNRLAAEGVQDLATLRTAARGRRGEQKLTFGIVFPFSSHHLLLRAWLESGGLRPDRDVRIVVVPPAQMARNLAAGTIDGFCAGEPWNSLCVQAGTGWCPAWSAALAPGHLEKVLLVRQSFATARADAHAALLAALDEAAAWCDEPANRPALVEMLAPRIYLDQPPAALAPALLGPFATGRADESVPDFLVFHRGGANVPAPERAHALQHELVAAGLVPAAPATAELPRRLFREDLYHAALQHRLHLHEHHR